MYIEKGPTMHVKLNASDIAFTVFS